MKTKKLLLIPFSILFSLTLVGCNNTPSNVPQSGTTQSVTGVSLNAETLSMYVGKKATLTATVTPNNGNQQVTWKSSNTSVATVKDGTISALKEGSTNITVTTKEGNYTATCIVTVIKESDDPYVPDTSDNQIYFITNNTLNNATYDSSKDEYTFDITSNYKQIYVNTPDKNIIVNLNGVTIENNENSPIYVQDCSNIELSAKKDTVNYIKDTRATYITDTSGQGKGAIYVDNGDLKLKGSGELNIIANYLNAIHVKDDVKIQKQSLNIEAVNHAIRGNDSVTILSGNISISCGGDALHTENSDISSKGNQKGNVTVSGGNITINSWGDAIQASYNAIIEQADNTVDTNLTIKTNKYSSYSGVGVETSTSNFYLKMNSSTYSSGNYTYAAYINNTWYPATYKGTQSSQQGGPGGGGRPGGSSTYYIYQLDKPNDAASFTLYRFNGNNVSSFSLEDYNAVSDAKAFNAAYDMVQISVSGNKINFSNWSNFSSGNNNSADISAKGVKAENEIYIKGGTIDIKSYDDAIHANNDGILENGSAPLGNVNIQGGDLTINASDDGIHADKELNISSGEVNIESYEGLEANVVNVSGGNCYVKATDDGINATQGKLSASVSVSGGYLDVEVPTSGDTDGIDSNGAFTQTGGVVILKGPGSASGNNFGAAALDTDGSVSLSNCTLIVFGGIEKTPSTSLTKTLCTSNTVSTGSHTVSFTNNTKYQTTLNYSSKGCVVYSVLGNATLS